MWVWDRRLRSVKHGAEMGVLDRPVNEVDAVGHLVMKKFNGFLFVGTIHRLSSNEVGNDS
ncbi:hypothetical protein M758_11G063200 [Ceratodon purpureus]|nr:hypothetical protein M758_11G063200 [Ceratodon purpureus]